MFFVLAFLMVDNGKGKSLLQIEKSAAGEKAAMREY